MTDADRSFFKDVMSEASALGLAWWERFALIMALAFILVAGKRLWLVLPKPTEPGPTPKMPDVADVPDAEWSNNVKPNDTPDAGGGA